MKECLGQLSSSPANVPSFSVLSGNVWDFCKQTHLWAHTHTLLKVCTLPRTYSPEAENPWKNAMKYSCSIIYRNCNIKKITSFEPGRAARRTWGPRVLRLHTLTPTCQPHAPSTLLDSWLGKQTIMDKVYTYLAPGQRPSTWVHEVQSHTILYSHIKSSN